MEESWKLTPDEVVHQNTAVYAEAYYQKFNKADFDKWMENEGIALTDFQVQSLCWLLC